MKSKRRFIFNQVRRWNWCRSALAATILIFAASASKSEAQLMLAPPPGVALNDGNADGNFTETAGAEFEGTYQATGGGVIKLTGDGVLDVVKQDAFDFLSVSAAVFVNVGPLPVEVDPVTDANYMVTVGGGTATAPSASFSFYFEIWEAGTLGPNDPFNFGQLGPQIVANLKSGGQVTGNGFQIVNDQVSGTPYILSPGQQYVFLTGTNLRVDASGLGVSDPNSSVFLAAGGLTDFDGIQTALNARVLGIPEPTTGGLMAIALVFFHMRSRHRMR
ncbi:MAG: hypothetical protein R3F19_16775 [Verrucomicrobiales bacterium]